MIGGGETADVTIPVSRLTAGEAYMFFCSFPGHASLMKGTLTVK
jgi:azurin